MKKGKYGEIKLYSGFARRLPTLPTRNLRDVWTIATAPHPEPHVAMFPESLVERAILCGSREGDTVLDPFAGSGTVGLVAQALNRRAILMDVSDSYVALMKGRDAA